MQWLYSQPVATGRVKDAVTGFLRGCGRPVDRGQYPFGDPVSMSGAHLQQLRTSGGRRAYYAADKSDGLRACCVLTETPEGYFAALVDRKGTIRAAVATADEALFAGGTLLDGELVVLSGGGVEFVVFDVAVLCGKGVVATLPLAARLAAAREALAGPGLRLGAGVRVWVKPMFQLPQEAADLEAHMKSLAYGTDGIILTPSFDGAPPPGPATSIWKLKLHHTVDCLWQDGHLLFGGDRELFPVSRLHMLFDAGQLSGVSNGTVVEMVADPPNARGQFRLHFLQPRPDKRAPNAFYTVEATLQSVKDAITLHAVVGALSENQSED